MKNKVTLEDINENMDDCIVETRIEFGQPITYVSVRMKNGFIIRESAACTDPANYDEEDGKKTCLLSISQTVRAFLNYQLQEDMYRNKSKEKTVLERLIDERQDLADKEEKLKSFVLSPETAEERKNISTYQLALLETQRKAMEWYHEILTDRIEDIKSTESSSQSKPSTGGGTVLEG